MELKNLKISKIIEDETDLFPDCKVEDAEGYVSDYGSVWEVSIFSDDEKFLFNKFFVEEEKADLYIDMLKK